MKRLLEMVEQSGRDILLGLDGGITRNDVGDASRTGADIIVTGSAVFDGKTPEANARQMLAAIAAAGKG